MEERQEKSVKSQRILLKWCTLISVCIIIVQIVIILDLRTKVNRFRQIDNHVINKRSVRDPLKFRCPPGCRHIRPDLYRNYYGAMARRESVIQQEQFSTSDRNKGAYGNYENKAGSGSPGSRGSVGTPGVPGVPGNIGVRGSQGYPGQHGTPGYSGSRATPGLQGPKGPPGPPGDYGYPGIMGSPGAPGLPGGSGSPGLPGLPGGQGSSGEIGTPGYYGTSGTPGLYGAQGSPGSHGLPGARGLSGLPGPHGSNGEHGGSGTYGITGSPGLPGNRGSPGVQGSNGDHRRPGYYGVPGNPGSSGTRGSPGRRGYPGTTGLSHSVNYNGNNRYTDHMTSNARQPVYEEEEDNSQKDNGPQLRNRIRGDQGTPPEDQEFPGNDVGTTTTDRTEQMNEVMKELRLLDHPKCVDNINHQALMDKLKDVGKVSFMIMVDLEDSVYCIVHA